MSLTLLYDLLWATGETLYMVSFSTLFAILLGLPLGTVLFCSQTIKPNPNLTRFLSTFINVTRSIPFIILLVALIPITRLIVGTSIGIHAAIVPLTLGATPFFARLVENVYQQLPEGFIETGFSMGATTWQIIRYILLPEARAPLIQAITVTAITLINYSAMAGTVGGGGLGDLAIRYGYQRFNVSIMIATILILILIVQGVQLAGDKLSRRVSKP
jgi:D-methionine transport system permease protein